MSNHTPIGVNWATVPIGAALVTTPAARAARAVPRHLNGTFVSYAAALGLVRVQVRGNTTVTTFSSTFWQPVTPSMTATIPYPRPVVLATACPRCGAKVKLPIPRNAAAHALGMASKGGWARADKLSPERRSEIAQQAARKRWGT